MLSSVVAPAAVRAQMSEAPYTPTAPTLFDGIPNWGLHATNTAVGSGSWNEAKIWSARRIPNANDTVLIPAGKTVLVPGAATSGDLKFAAARTVVVSGSLQFGTNRNTLLAASTVLVRPDGELKMGTPGRPVPAKFRASLQFRPSVYTAAEDPAQHANGLLVLGKFTARGAAKTSFTRLSAAPVPGTKRLSFASPVVGWRKGDRIALPDSRSPYQRVVVDKSEASRTEIVVVSSVAMDGLSVTLSAPVKWAHAGSFARPGEKPLLPHALNLTRNVVLSSAAPGGVRGHVLVGGAAGVADVENAGFLQLGRTSTAPLDPVANRIGRYSLHFHHCTGPFAPLGVHGNRSRVVGCAFDDSPKWQVAIHGTSAVRLEGNALHGAKGSAVVTEDGNERDNEIVGNIAVNVPGVPNEWTPSPRKDPNDFGSEGVGFWLAGNGNTVTDNIAADCRLMGLLVFPHTRRAKLLYPMSPEAKSCCFSELHRPFNDFVFSETPCERNEVYATMHGMDFWKDMPFTVRDSVVWNCVKAMVPKGCRNLVIDGLIVRGQPHDGPLPYLWEPSIGLDNRYYPVVNTVRNLDVAGCDIGMKTLTAQGVGHGGRILDVTVEDSRFMCKYGVWIDADLHYKRFSTGPSRAFVKNCRFEPLPGRPYFQSVFAHLLFANDQHMVAGDEVWVQNYQGRAGDNWRLFYKIQDPNFIMPHSSPYGGMNWMPANIDFMTYWDGTRHFRIGGIPEAGLTNARSWAKYGKAVAGSVATTRYIHPEMDGYAQKVPQTATPFPQPVVFIGHRDVADGRGIQGWVADRNDEHHVPMDILVDGVKRGQIVADQYRPDMYGRVGYRWTYPVGLRDGKSHEVRFVRSGTSVLAPGFPVRVTPAP